MARRFANQLVVALATIAAIVFFQGLAPAMAKFPEKPITLLPLAIEYSHIGDFTIYGKHEKETVFFGIDDYMPLYSPYIKRAEARELAQCYVVGLMMDGDRKSVEPMSEKVLSV